MKNYYYIFITFTLLGTNKNGGRGSIQTKTDAYPKVKRTG